MGAAAELPLLLPDPLLLLPEPLLPLLLLPPDPLPVVEPPPPLLPLPEPAGALPVPAFCEREAVLGVEAHAER